MKAVPAKSVQIICTGWVADCNVASHPATLDRDGLPLQTTPR
jgi:hypothetical protein